MKKARVLGLVWMVCVWGTLACSGPEAVPGEVPGAVSEDAPLTDEEIFSVPALSLEAFVKVYEELRQQEPALDPERPAFARRLLERIKNRQTLSTLSVSALSVPTTRAEWRLMVKFPQKVVPSWLASNRAEARALTLDYGYGLQRGRADAFRHAYWNVLMAKCCGLEWARDFATAHESDSFSRDDTVMDLNNNEVGRNIYSSAPGASDEEHVQKLMDFATSCMSSGVTGDTSRLVYMLACPSLRVSFIGPPGTVVDVALDGTRLGTIPTASFIQHEPKDFRTGTHSLELTCVNAAGNKDGCPVSATGSLGMMLFGNGSIIQVETIPEGTSRTVSIRIPTFGMMGQVKPVKP